MVQEKFYILTGEELNQVAGGCTDTNNSGAIDANSNADFVNVWHGLGCDHQSAEQPGLTAQDRHNFLGTNDGGITAAYAGGSTVNPTYNGAKG